MKLYHTNEINEMTKMKWIVIVTTLFTIVSKYTYGQGCSDAGFCTLNGIKPNSNDSTTMLNNQFKIGAFLGNADHAIAVYGNYVEYNRQLNKKFGLDVKLTSIAQNGNGIATFGVSDLFVNLNMKASEKVKLTLGTKIPLSAANKTYNNLPLPMDYQASLGTLDLILGIGFEVKDIQFVAALQQPLSQNDNQFLAVNYPLGSALRSFQSTHTFIRSGDVLLRVSYPIELTSKFKFTPSILPIYHLANDKYTDELNVTKEIIGSQGLTLNGNVYLDYKVNTKNILQLNIGMPFMVRDVRPDGLTRSFIANLEYRIKF